MKETEILRGLGKARSKNYARGTAFLEGPGTGTSDSIPAHLSRGEAVLPAKTVQAVGSKNLARLITETNGKAPQQGLRSGGQYAYGVVGDADQYIKTTTPAEPVARPTAEAARYQNAANVRANPVAVSAPPNIAVKPAANPLGPAGLKIPGTAAPIPMTPPSYAPAAAEVAPIGRVTQAVKGAGSKLVAPLKTVGSLALKGTGVAGGLIGGVAAGANIADNGLNADNGTDLAANAALVGGALASAPVAVGAGAFLAGKAGGGGAVKLAAKTDWGHNLINRMAGVKDEPLLPAAQKFVDARASAARASAAPSSAARASAAPAISGEIPSAIPAQTVRTGQDKYTQTIVSDAQRDKAHLGNLKQGEGYVTMTDPETGRRVNTHINPPTAPQQQQQAAPQDLRAQLIDKMLNSGDTRISNRAQNALQALDSNNTAMLGHRLTAETNLAAREQKAIEVQRENAAAGIKARDAQVRSSLTKIRTENPKTGAVSFVDDEEAVRVATNNLDAQNIDAQQYNTDPAAARAAHAPVLSENAANNAFIAAGTGNLFGQAPVAGDMANATSHDVQAMSDMANGAGVYQTLRSKLPFTNKGMVSIPMKDGSVQTRSLATLRDSMDPVEYSNLLLMLQSNNKRSKNITGGLIANGR